MFINFCLRSDFSKFHKSTSEKGSLKYLLNLNFVKAIRSTTFWNYHTGEQSKTKNDSIKNFCCVCGDDHIHFIKLLSSIMFLDFNLYIQVSV